MKLVAFEKINPNVLVWVTRSCQERESFRIRRPKNPITHRANIKIIDMLKNLLGFLVNQIDSLLVFTMTDEEGELSVRRCEIDFFCGVLSSVVSSVVESSAVSLTDGAGEAVGSSALSVYTMVKKDRRHNKNGAPTEEFHVSRFTNPTDLWQTTNS